MTFICSQHLKVWNGEKVVVITLLTIFSLGIFQAIITNQSKLMGGLILSFNSIISTSIAFSIGYGLEYLIIHN